MGRLQEVTVDRTRRPFVLLAACPHASTLTALLPLSCRSLPPPLPRSTALRLKIMTSSLLCTWTSRASWASCCAAWGPGGRSCP